MKTRAAYAIIALDSFLPLLRGQLPSRRYVTINECTEA
jgi:hypothetical protein